MSLVRKIVIAMLLVSLVAISSLTLAQDSTPGVTVKLAVFGPFTGQVAAIGQEQLNWAKLAVEDFNAESGWNVEILEADTQLNPANAVTAAQSVVGDADVYGAVGPAGSQEVQATAQIFQDAHLVHISGSASDPALTTAGFDTFFRTVPTDAVQGPTDANFLYGLGKENVFVIDDQSSYSVGLADQFSETFEADGGTVVGRESVTQQDTDFSALVTRIGSSGADSVFFPGQVASQGALFARQLQEQGVDVTLMGADGFQSVDDFIKGAAGATEGAYVSAFAPDIHTVEADADIVQRATEKYGEFGTFGPPTYVAAQVVLEAMQRAFAAGNLTREAVRDEVANTDIDKSILGGPMYFDENGDVEGAHFYIFQVQGDNFVFVPTEEATPGATPQATETAEVARPSFAGGPGEAVNLTGDPQSGAQLFVDNCQKCHGPNGVGGVANEGSDDGTIPPLNPIDETLISSDPQVYAYNLDLFIEHGSVPAGPSPKETMPAWGDEAKLTPQQIADLIAYVESLNPAS
jgi:branched-chain amino acid transport system substrate-binding protein